MVTKAPELAHHAGNQSGFTMVELMIVMIVSAILMAGSVQFLATDLLRKIEQQIQDSTLGQMSRIAQAARIYRLENTGQWPDQANLCASAYATLNSAGRVPGISGISPYGTTYTTSCTTGLSGHFSVGVDVGDTTVASSIGNALPARTITGTVVTGIWDVAGAEPALDAVLDLAGTKPMTGNLDLGGNALINADDVITTTGQSLASAVVFKSELVPGETVNKPTCPAGMTAQPFIDGFRRQSLPSSGAIHGKDVTVTDLGTSWRFDPVMVGPSGFEAVTGTHVRFVVSVKCS